MVNDNPNDEATKLESDTNEGAEEYHDPLWCRILDTHIPIPEPVIFLALLLAFCSVPYILLYVTHVILPFQRWTVTVTIVWALVGAYQVYLATSDPGTGVALWADDENVPREIKIRIAVAESIFVVSIIGLICTFLI